MLEIAFSTMSKNLHTSVIRLNQEASNSVEAMLAELSKEDKNLKTNYSNLASFILSEFYKRSFARLKPKLILEFQDKKKHLKDKIETLAPKELEAAIQFLEKRKKPVEEPAVKNE